MDLYSRVREIVEEYLLRESDGNVTGNIAGYQTPIAFYKRSVSQGDMYRDLPSSSSYTQKPPTKKLNTESLREARTKKPEKHYVYKATFQDGETYYAMNINKLTKSSFETTAIAGNTIFRDLRNQGKKYDYDLVGEFDSRDEAVSQMKKMARRDKKNNINDIERLGREGRRPGTTALNLPADAVYETKEEGKTVYFIKESEKGRVDNRMVDEKSILKLTRGSKTVQYYRLRTKNINLK